MREKFFKRLISKISLLYSNQLSKNRGNEEHFHSPMELFIETTHQPPKQSAIKFSTGPVIEAWSHQQVQFDKKGNAGRFNSLSLISDRSVSRPTLFLQQSDTYLWLSSSWIELMESRWKDENQQLFMCQRESNGVPHWNRIWGKTIQIDDVHQSKNERAHVTSRHYLVGDNTEKRVSSSNSGPRRPWFFSRSF